MLDYVLDWLPGTQESQALSLALAAPQQLPSHALVEQNLARTTPCFLASSFGDSLGQDECWKLPGMDEAHDAEQIFWESTVLLVQEF